MGRHLRNMLNQPDGNFAHQLMEQMNPFEFLVYLPQISRISPLHLPM